MPNILPFYKKLIFKYNLKKGVFVDNKIKNLIIKSLKDDIPTLQALYLFGSQNDNTATQKSDIDLAYLSEGKLTPLQIWEISQKLANILSMDVDLVDIKETDTIFRYQIISTSSRIYGEGYEVESFETLAFSFYLRFQEERKPIIDAIKKRKSILA
jgi:predicted nucleotidyltransferase